MTQAQGNPAIGHEIPAAEISPTEGHFHGTAGCYTRAAPSLLLEAANEEVLSGKVGEEAVETFEVLA